MDDKVTSFDSIEQWWHVIVEGGYVGKKNGELKIFEFIQTLQGKFSVFSYPRKLSGSVFSQQQWKFMTSTAENPLKNKSRQEGKL